uniref:Uncharacterized protein n=1 Tax=Siphoviridae sp. ctrgt10 TaxID=2826479 RepID=A0A8S5M7I6_9CAUD|nr:MAG TPA: hypothetical protein [Siphoviridae sp. ctrgt10]
MLIICCYNEHLLFVVLLKNAQAIGVLVLVLYKAPIVQYYIVLEKKQYGQIK